MAAIAKDDDATSASPDSRRSQLSIDDLADAGDASQSFATDTKRVEAKLQQNLQQQQQHFARQRKLFEALGRDSVLGLSPTSDNDDASTSERSSKFTLGLEPSKAKAVATRGVRRVSTSDRDDEIDDNEDDAIAIERLQRKAKSIANYHSRIAATNTRGSLATKTRGNSLRRLDESAAHYESSNEALRKQLELLRRLQLENNRFRHENRSLREQNDVLEEQTTLHTREIKRLQDEIQDLSLRVQHDQLELATAAQNVRKLKQLQKQLEALHTERDQLQTALQEAKDQDAQLRLHTQSEIESVVQETKHLKRSLKQARQHGAQLQEQIEELKVALATSEQNATDLKRQLHTMQRENGTMAAQLSEKTTHIESIESSATQCVERMEAGMEALQKAHNSERDKRRKLEKLRDTLQNDVDSLESEKSKLEMRVQELETYNSQLQQRLQDWKLEKKQDKEFQDEKHAEFHERHKSDAKTIAALRDECATYEHQLEAARASVVDVRKEVATESNALRKEVEALRNYIEDAQRAPVSGSGDNASSELLERNDLSLASASRARREELWTQLPELQFLQGAMGGLRNETMNFVSDFQRTRHQLRQSGAALAAAQERVVELEHLRSEDALARKELEDQRILAEQAREITLREKMEVLAWSQQACEKSERLETALTKCSTSVQSVIKKTRRAVATVDSALATGDVAAMSGSVSLLSSKSDEDAEAYASRLVSVMEREVQDFAARVEALVDVYKASTQESSDRQQRIARLDKELEAQRQDHVAVVADIETLHARTISEKHQLFTASLQAAESERDTLEKALEDERAAVATVQAMNDALDTRLAELEQDVPVFATIVQLFALVVPPLVLQVNDLLMQKRVLMRENAEYAMAHEQVECIGQVLRELVPAGVLARNSPEMLAEQRRRQLRRRFRRVVIAVFAINRLQRSGFCGSAAGTGDSVYGICTSLKPAKKKKKTGLSLSSSFNSGSSSSCLPPSTVIKVLPPKPLLARLSLRTMLDRLRAMDLRAKLSAVVDASTVDGHGASSFGSLLLHVLSALDPVNNDVLVEDTAGGFHCRALLERRKPTRWHDASGSHEPEDARLSTVDLIRKRILALGKRVEDLHYQRNSLQKENYEFQYQLDQHATQLREMDVLSQKNDDLQQKVERLHDEQRAAAAANDAELTDIARTLEEREQRISAQQAEITRLEKEIADFETRISELELEKTDLHHALLTAKSASVAEEEKLHKSRIGMDKQAEELRSLKQAAKRAHELHQRVAWQLEQELVEKASLQATMEHLRKQKETLEREVARAKVRVLDASAGAEEADGGDGGPAQPRDATLGGSASSTGSYDRQLQDLTDRIANMRTASFPIPDEDDDQDCDKETERQGTTHGSAETKRPQCHPSSDTFRSEWQRLDISGVFDDGATKTDKGAASRAGPAPNASPARRSGDEIDKVNSAVHDYMDRIDEKLQQMYGIPKSSSRLRPPPTASVIHGPAATPGISKKKGETRWGDAIEFE